MKAHGIYTDLEDCVRVVIDWVDFQAEVISSLSEITQVVPYLSVRELPFLFRCCERPGLRPSSRRCSVERFLLGF